VRLENDQSLPEAAAVTQEVESVRYSLRTAALGVCAAVMLLTLGCGGASGNTAGQVTAALHGCPDVSSNTYPALTLKGWAKPARKQYKVLFAGVKPINPYVVATYYGAEEAAKKLNIDLTCQFNNFDAQQQLQQVESAIATKQYDGLLLPPLDGHVLCRALSKDAPAAGIKVVVVTLPVCGDENYTPGTVGISAAQTIAQYRRYLPFAYSSLGAQGGEVAVLTGPAPDTHTVLIKQALDEAKARFPNVDVVQVISGPYTAASGLQEAQTVLSAHPDVKLIVSLYDENTKGAVTALKSAGRQPGQIKLFDLGGDKTTTPLIKEGWVQGIMRLSPIEEDGQGLEMLVAALEGRSHPNFNDLSQGSMSEITPANVDKYQPEY
jgi:ABC-type sugar transport system substrate-binding protein